MTLKCRQWEEKSMLSVKDEIEKLKKEKNAVILAHYYVPGEVQEIADYVGDSYYLSKKARETEAEIIVFAGVAFMGESAKILNPGKKVLLPDYEADCPMAHMATREKVEEMRGKYEDLAVVCYINSTAEVIGITGVHTEEGWYNQDINETHITFYFMSDEEIDFAEIQHKKKKH